jgi:putative dimethyl sulfoxide reductase chaperone
VSETAPIDWQETLTGEMLLLGILGRIFYTYPNNEERTWLQSLIDEEIFSEAPFAIGRDETTAGLKFLQKWGEDGLTDEIFEKLQSDYTRLFIGPGKVIAAPWESVYFGEERLTFQEQTLEVRNWYRRFGLQAEKIYQEPDDHIGLELLFLSRLAALGVQALDKEDDSSFQELLEAQRGFLEQHLGAWALTWCGLVEINARTDFYRGLAYLTRGAIIALSDVLDVKVVKDIPL